MARATYCATLPERNLNEARGGLKVSDVTMGSSSTTRAAEAIEEALAQPSLCAAFQVTAAANADRPALRDLGVERELTWRDYADRVRNLATGFTALGVQPGDTVRSEEHTSELQSHSDLVCRLLLEK